ncbi:transcription initiation factor TFIID subunit 9-like [Chenopodium quinoa]|uniref:transcription initiation factor TFIID subunit 9-like n=1 Tax=Chenopodium quinoa TaxID=63459 RepID=UPI000B76C8DD|nr:transcription initiation factor TFIID subunit 9-like [Chenopodium quinoa]
MDEGEEDLPRDAKIIKSLLKFMGVEEHEPRVVHQFLDLWYGYVVDVLTDAQVYYEHAGKTSIDCDDVKLTIQSKVNFSFSQPPPREIFSNRSFYFGLHVLAASLYFSFLVWSFSIQATTELH